MRVIQRVGILCFQQDSTSKSTEHERVNLLKEASS